MQTAGSTFQSPHAPARRVTGTGQYRAPSPQSLHFWPCISWKMPSQKGVEMHVRWSQDQKKDLWVPSSPAQGTGSHLQGPEHLRHSLTGRRDRANASTQMTPVPELHATVQ